MPKKIRDPQPPSGLSRLMWRLPIWLYKARLGRLLGKRFLLLNHIGRKSGLPRQAVLEVIHYDKERNCYLVASGFGKKSQWYQNLLHTPEVTIQVGGQKLAVVADMLLPEVRADVMADYAKRNPKTARYLMHLIGYEVDGSEEDYRAMGRDVIPIVAFRRR